VAARCEDGRIPLEIQKAVTRLVVEILGADTADTPVWLMRPGSSECGACWPLARTIYADLTAGGELPDTMPPRERRAVDCVLVVGGAYRILEVDEKQHFNRFRARALKHYAGRIPVAFPIAEWIAASSAKTKLEGGGFAKPRPPLFPAVDGRHQQRAFRDALADMLPIEYGWLPTLRVADFEVKDWIFGSEAETSMNELLVTRL
jgi:hypothetical protein